MKFFNNTGRRFVAVLTATTTDPFVFDSIKDPDSTKCNNIPVTHPINNRHERRKQKVMKRKK